MCLPQEQEQYDGKGLGEVCLRHKSALQRNKEASEAAGSSSPTARVRTLPRSELHAKCVGVAENPAVLLNCRCVSRAT